MVQYHYVYPQGLYARRMREFVVSDLHCTTVWPQNPTWEAVKFPSPFPPLPPLVHFMYRSLYTNIQCTRSVPILCPCAGYATA